MAKCPDCGSESLLHRRGSLGCLSNQMPAAERAEQKSLGRKGLKKLATFLGTVIFLVWFVPYECRTGELWPAITFIPFGLGWFMGWWNGLQEGQEEGRMKAAKEYLDRRHKN